MNMLWKVLHQLAEVKFIYKLLGKFIPWLSIIFIILFSYGIYAGLFLAPMDYQQKDAFRIMYVHVPAAMLSLSIYTIICINSIVYLIWKIKIADLIAKSSAEIGAVFCFLALVTGAIWGKPMWGTWWVWDARLSSELILLFIYLGYIGLRNAIPTWQRAAKISAIFAVIGFIDIPIVHYSVKWWQTLHQGPSIVQFAKPTIELAMLKPLIILIIAFYCFYSLILCISVRANILIRNKSNKWVKQEVCFE